MNTVDRPGREALRQEPDHLVFMGPGLSLRENRDDSS